MLINVVVDIIIIIDSKNLSIDILGSLITMMTMTTSHSSWPPQQQQASSSSSLVRQSQQLQQPPSKLYPDLPKSNPGTVAMASTSKSTMTTQQPSSEPQPVDDADRTLFLPLRKASEAIAIAMRADEDAVPHLDAAMFPNVNNTLLSSAAYDDADAYEPYPFRLARSIELPDALFAEMKSEHATPSAR